MGVCVPFQHENKHHYIDFMGTPRSPDASISQPIFPRNASSSVFKEMLIMPVPTVPSRSCSRTLNLAGQVYYIEESPCRPPRTPTDSSTLVSYVTRSCQYDSKRLLLILHQHANTIARWKVGPTPWSEHGFYGLSNVSDGGRAVTVRQHAMHGKLRANAATAL